MRIVLVHSPFVGPASWLPVATELTDLATEVVTPDATAVFAGPGPYVGRFIDAVVAAVRPTAGGAGGAGGTVLVGHSRAGGLLPGVAARLGDVVATVYVDAVLPSPGCSWTDEAPPAEAEQRRAMAVDGRLPRWDTWFGAAAMAELVPDPEQRAAALAGTPRVPLSYLDEPMPDAPDPRPAGYLLLSEAYRPEAGTAAAAGMPVREHLSHHLAAVTDPTGVAAEIRALLDDLRDR